MRSTYEDGVELRGHWWRADDSRTRVPGVLAYSLPDGGQLRLIGGLSKSDIFGQRDEDGFRVLGEAEGERLTLESCYSSSSTNRFGGLVQGTTETLRFGRLLRGIHIPNGEPLLTTQLAVRLLHARYWGSTTQFAESVRVDADEAAGHDLHHEWATDQSVKLASGDTLELVEKFIATGDVLGDRTWSRDLVFRVKGAPSAFDERMHVALLLMHLVSIGTDEIATLEDLEAISPTSEHERERPFTIYAEWFNWPERSPKPLRPHQLPFTMHDLGGLEAVGRWCDKVAPQRILLNRVLATRRRGGYVDDRLLARAVALEGLDRSLHPGDEPSFKARLLRCVDLAGAVFADAIGDRDRWAKAVKAERTEAAHHLDLGAHQDGVRLHWLAESAFHLFVLCLLRHAEADDATFDSYSHSPMFTFMGERVRQVLTEA